MVKGAVKTIKVDKIIESRTTSRGVGVGSVVVPNVLSVGTAPASEETHKIPDKVTSRTGTAVVAMVDPALKSPPG